SATSIDPSDHSPFIAKVLSARATMKTEKPGDNATIDIISENIAILTASSLRRPVTVGSSPRARGTLGPGNRASMPTAVLFTTGITQEMTSFLLFNWRSTRRENQFRN